MPATVEAESDESCLDWRASQSSEVGSIPIARSINPDDSVDLTRLSPLNSARNRPILDGSWTVLRSIGRSLRRPPRPARAVKPLAMFKKNLSDVFALERLASCSLALTAKVC